MTGYGSRQTQSWVNYTLTGESMVNYRKSSSSYISPVWLVLSNLGGYVLEERKIQVP